MNIYGNLFISISISLLLNQATTQWCRENIYKTKRTSACKTFDPYSRSCREFHQQNFYELRCFMINDTIQSDHSEDVYYIYIYNANITVGPNLFVNFSNVKSISIQESITKSDAFHNLANLESLTLTRNCMDVLYRENFNTGDKLESLYLSDNDISVVEDDVLEEFVNLKILQLDKNVILDASPLLSNCGNISTLILSNNLIKRIEFTPDCLKLKTLSLDSNAIEEFNVNIVTTSELEYLNLSRNNIKHIESDSLKHFAALKVLDLSNNPLFQSNDLPANLFQNKPKLEYLSLSRTELPNIVVGSFAKLFALKTLDLSYNNLRYLPKHLFHNLTKIRSIFLNNNYLTQFEYDARAYELTIVDLNNNLLDCHLLENISQALQKKSVFLLWKPSGKLNSSLGVGCVVNEWRKNQPDIKEETGSLDFNDIQQDLHKIIVEQENLYNLSNYLYESVKRDMKKIADLQGSYRSMVVGIYFILFILIAGLAMVSVMLFRKYKIVKKSAEELRNLNSFDT